ncbi:MAG: DUF452 family protein [Bacteroides sp.]|nr:DUF452 family protein [Bacteroides sp.]
MTYEFISRNNNSCLIVIFAGWSTDTSFYAHINHPGWDILVVSGYSDLNFPEETLESYSTIALFAWSMGVYAASQCFPFERASVAVAINGTEQPVDNSYGIPENIFFGTADNLNERNLTKFRRRMAGDAFKDIADKFSSSSIADLKTQLYFIGQHSKANKSRGNSRWHRVYVSKSDMIFPADSQKAAWQQHQSQPQIVEIDAPHYVDLFPIIKTLLPLHNAVGKRFKKALPTYNDTASPQNLIAAHLIDMATTHVNYHNPFNRILEIGPGTGFLTRRFVDKFRPHSIDFIELYEQEPFNLVPEENYFVADAEEWTEENAHNNCRRYDAIISASTIQWFVNIGKFFRNAATLLNPGGMLICSTFLPGNLGELQGVNPYGLIYHSAKELRDLISDSFSLLAIEEEKIVAKFDSSRATLEHLIKTGVGGTSRSSLPIGELLQRLPTQLTYTPLYILAIKK